MQKRNIILLSTICAASTIAIIVAFVWATKPVPLTDEEIQIKFDCFRATTDSRATDVYCGNPELYRQHAEENDVIGPGDYHRTM